MANPTVWEKLTGVAFRPNPLWPAGYLPLKGGDPQLRRPLAFFNVGDWRTPQRHPISSLEGEIAGRPEGGGAECCPAKMV